MDTLPSCPVCRSQETLLWSAGKDYEYHSTDKEYFYYHCHRCNCIYIDPMPINDLKTIYPSNYYSFTKNKKNWAFRIKEYLDRRLFSKLLRNLNQDQINVLDVGGGNGWLLDLVKKMDERTGITQVVDIDPEARQEAEQNGHLYFEGRIEEFYTKHKFHLVLMLNLIEHVSNPEKVLQGIQKILAPDGIILIKTPNTQSWDAKLFRNSYWGGLHCPRHWVIFSEKGFRILLHQTSLAIESLEYTQGGPFWAFSIIANLSRKRILRTDRQRPVIFHPLFPVISSLFAAFDFIRRPFAKTSQMFIVLRHKKT